MSPAPRPVWSASLVFLLLSTPALAGTPTYLTQWGSAGSGTSQFNFAHHLAVSPGGTVYVGDLLNNRVQRFNSSGSFLSLWLRSGADGVAVAPDGSVYVVGNDLVSHYTSTGGLLGSWGSTGSGPGQFASPLDVAVDASGNVYVSEFQNHRVQKFTATGTYLTQWGSSGTGDGQFDVPFGLAVEPAGTVLVADVGNSRIQRFTAGGVFVSAWGTAGSGPGEFLAPGRPCVEAGGLILVPDQGNGRIQAYRADGTFVDQWGGPGSGPGQFQSPTCVAVDGANALYVMDKDNARVQKFGALETRAYAITWGALKRTYR